MPADPAVPVTGGIGLAKAEDCICLTSSQTRRQRWPAPARGAREEVQPSRWAQSASFWARTAARPALARLVLVAQPQRRGRAGGARRRGAGAAHALLHVHLAHAALGGTRTQRAAAEPTATLRPSPGSSTPRAGRPRGGRCEPGARASGAGAPSRRAASAAAAAPPAAPARNLLLLSPRSRVAAAERVARRTGVA